mgnify:CR=1 FL=1
MGIGKGIGIGIGIGIEVDIGIIGIQEDSHLIKNLFSLNEQ